MSYTREELARTGLKQPETKNELSEKYIRESLKKLAEVGDRRDCASCLHVTSNTHKCRGCLKEGVFTNWKPDKQGKE